VQRVQAAHDLPGEVGRVHLGEVPALDDVLVQLSAGAEWEDHVELAAHLNHAITGWVKTRSVDQGDVSSLCLARLLSTSRARTPRSTASIARIQPSTHYTQPVLPDPYDATIMLLSHIKGRNTP
jgi:hypothetical protein